MIIHVWIWTCTILFAMVNHRAYPSLPGERFEKLIVIIPDDIRIISRRCD